MKTNSSTNNQRFAMIDAIRGTAILMMFIYHFSWDLDYFKFARFDFYQDPFWLNFRTIIVSLFLIVMGISLYLAHQQGFKKRNFLKRFYWLVACALLITASTYIFDGERFIYFGILHFITIASLMALPFIKLYWTNLVLGAAIIVSGITLNDEFFNPRYLNWIGLVSAKPQTDDYVPLLPWFGVVLLGMFIARWASQKPAILSWSDWRADSAASRLLRLAGRHSLLIYMLHQPLFIGILYVVYQIIHN